MTDKQIEALKLALEALEVLLKEPIAHKAANKAEYLLLQAAPAIREALAEESSGTEQPTQEILAWKNAAIRVGEELSSVGPNGYYNMTADQWLAWAMDQQPRGKNSLAEQPVPKWQGVRFDSALHDQPTQCWKCGDMDAIGHSLCTVPACGMREQPAQGCDYCNHPQYAGTKCKNCGSETAQQQKPVAKVVSTAPERIWLDLGFNPEVEYEISFDDLFEATWSHDNATGNGIEYVRADLAPASKPLTDEQIMEMYNEPRSDAEMIAFARAIEVAHGIGEQK